MFSGETVPSVRVNAVFSDSRYRVDVVFAYNRSYGVGIGLARRPAKWRLVDSRVEWGNVTLTRGLRALLTDGDADLRTICLKLTQHLEAVSNDGL